MRLSPLIAGALSAAAIASFIIVWVTRCAPFSNVAATFYGFASAFAFLLLSSKAFSTTAMISPALGNVLICISVSLLIGSLLGALHQRLAND